MIISSARKVEALTHDEASRKNIPTAEHQSVIDAQTSTPIQVAYERRNPDLDPQLVWRGKDVLDWSDLVVQAPPLFIQEKVHPKVLIDDLLRRTATDDRDRVEELDLFADFNGLPDEARSTEFYQHEANWTNRMILGDSLQVMASLAEREGLRGKVQCIYIDPPYGIKFNSNFQWSTTSRDVKDGKADHITREPEQVKAFRDTWRDGIHSYLTYLRDRLTVARDLLTESGSIFVQIGDENVHRVRALMDDVFGEDNFARLVFFKKTAGDTSTLMPAMGDFVVWYAKNREAVKFRSVFVKKELGRGAGEYYRSICSPDGSHFRSMSSAERATPSLIPEGWEPFTSADLKRAGYSNTATFSYEYQGSSYHPGATRQWKTNREGLDRLNAVGWLHPVGAHLRYRRFFRDFTVSLLGNNWTDTETGSFIQDKVYVVQTGTKVVERCLLMASDPGDLVLDPTCGSGTTAYVAEQWGRRWITIDTSRVALALARVRIMGARYPYYLLADSRDGQHKEAEVTRSAPPEAPTRGDIRQGFVYERVPHITLKSIANNAEIDVIWDEFRRSLDPLRDRLNEALGTEWAEWEIPREPGYPWSPKAREAWEKARKTSTSIATRAKHVITLNEELGRSYSLDDLPDAPVDLWDNPGWIDLHRRWWEARIARQKEIDASIAAKADFEYLYDSPYDDGSKVRVAGPFTVESLSPHRTLGVDEEDELIDPNVEIGSQSEVVQDFPTMILENLRTAGVQQAHKEDKIEFSSIATWPGELVCADARYFEGDDESGTERRAGIFIGPEFGTVQREDLVRAARECGEAGFDVLIACAFAFGPHASDFTKLGRIPVLKARMNAELHMAADLKNTGKGNLFVIFGEPDIDILPAEGDDAEDGQIRVKINGVDVFHPNTGEIRSDGAEGIACWFIDTNYNEESFFVRHAYFLGANDPYKALKTTLKAEINREAWETLHSDTSRPFDKPESGRIAVKVINHLGDEVMKVFRVD